MKPILGVVFDLYGTLFDVHSVAQGCDGLHPGRGLEISALWRQKQLEYTWLRSVMGKYKHFEQVTEDALNFVDQRLALKLDAGAKRSLCDAYLRLSPFAEVPAALAALNGLKLPLAILSNGSDHSIRTVVGHAGLTDQFAHLISVQQCQVFKPHPTVYALAERDLKLPRDQLLFVSSNAWDASGARTFGYPVCWINRSGNTFDELDQRPDRVLQGLDQLVHALAH